MPGTLTDLSGKTFTILNHTVDINLTNNTSALQSVDLSGTDLSGADLQGADLTNTKTGPLVNNPDSDKLPTGFINYGNYILGSGIDNYSFINAFN